MRILVVDDELVSRSKLQVIMQCIAECDTADNGQEALRVIEESLSEKRPYDLICLDVNMPEMDGYEVCRVLKDNPLTNSIPIIFITVEEDTDCETQGFGMGAADYIKKPFIPAVVKARVQTHLDLKKHRDCLAEMVADRTAELEQANHKLSSLDREKMVFLRFLSHEMNTSLSCVGATNIIDREEVSEENRELLDVVEQGFLRINDLVKNVLSYFEFAGKELKLRIRNVSVGLAVSDILKRYASRIDSAGLRVINQTSDDMISTADSGFLYKFLEILIENAIVFSEQGGMVTVAASGDSRSTRLSITDTGKGIARENLENIFTPFAMDACQRRENGYGLNLPMAKAIAQAHGWTLRAESPGEGQGATFIIEHLLAQPSMIGSPT